MKKAIGSEIGVFLIGEADTQFAEVFGVLVDVSDDTLYIQSIDDHKTYMIPRRNVKYCTTNEVRRSENVTDALVGNLPISIPVPEAEVINDRINDRINVYINNDHIASIPVPPTFNLSKWNDDIYSVIMGNPDVSNYLVGRIQKKIEYSPGEVYITIGEEKMPNPNTGNNTFSMGAGSPYVTMVNPNDMVKRLSNVAGIKKKE